MCGTPGRLFDFYPIFNSHFLKNTYYCRDNFPPPTRQIFPVPPETRFLLTYFFACLAWALDAQNPFRSPLHLGIEVGIMGPSCLAEDREGFLWVGTWEGLLRFDSAHARQIYYKPEKNESFGAVNDIDYDETTNTLWVCSDRGICWYDLNTKVIEQFRPETYFSKSEVDRGNICVFQDRQGDWWGDFNAKGLTCYAPRDNRVERFVVSESQIQGAGLFDFANTIKTVVQDVYQDSIIWAGTRWGLIRVNKSSKILRYYRYKHPDVALEETCGAITCLVSHRNGRIYIGTWSGGLLEFDPATQQFKHYLPEPEKPDYQGRNNGVYTLSENGPDAFWVSSKIKNQLRVTPIPEGQVKRFVIDTSGPEIYIKKYGKSGVLSLNTVTQAVRPLPFSGNTNPTTDGDILEFTTKGLLANDMERLYILPEGGQRFIPTGYSLPTDAGWFYAKSLPNKGVVITGTRGYLFHFKPDSTTPISYTPNTIEDGIPNGLNGFKVMDVDSWGRAWIRSTGGFVIFDPRNGQFLRFPYASYFDKILPDIREFCADPKGRMWVCGPTEIGWIDQAHPEQGIQRLYNASNGFNFTQIGNLQANKRGFIWFTCVKGLVRFSPDQESCNIYPASGGNMDLLPDGRLAVPFMDGVSLFHPDSLRTDTTLPRPYATWFKVLDKEKPLPGELLSPNEIWLASNENFISIGFSALGFFRPEDFQFAYQLVGVNDDWVNADADNLVAAYTALDGGDYVFRLKVRDATGHWSNQPFELRIHIATPWYRTWLAWLCYLGLLVWAARWWLRNRDWQLLVQQKLREEQREAERLKDLDHFRNRFFTNITHEFRTPLTVILGMAGELEADAKAEQTVHGLKSNMQRSLPLIRRNGQRLLDLVNQMLALARLDAGSLPVQMKRSDVMSHLRILVEAFHSYAVSQKIGLQFHAAPEQFEMDFDPELLQRIVGNLISNALKFTEEYGNVLVTARVAAKQGQGEKLLIEVRDSGVGIPEEQIPRIFDRFYHGGSVPLRGEESSGVGLALVKEIVNLLHGRIEVASQPERGSTFRVELPVTRNAQQEATPSMPTFIPPVAARLPNDADELAGSAKPLALVVEDNADVLDYIRACLLPDWEVVAARNGTTGLAVALEKLPDVIISDVMMPGMDGFALTEAAKTNVRTSHIPVLLLTARSGRADLIKGLSKGADDYLVKPFDKAELLLRLHNFHQCQLLWQNKPSAPEPSDPLPPIERAFLDQVDAAIEARLDETDFRTEH